MSPLWPAILPFAVFFVFLVVFSMRRPKACPDCRKPLPLLQSPLNKTKRQWWEGGYVCRNCGCEADIAGNKVPAGAAPQRRSITGGMALLTFSIAVAVALVTVLLSR